MSGKFPGNFRDISGTFPGKFREMSGNIPGDFREISGKFPGNIREFSGKFAGNIQISGKYPGISGKYPGIFPEISGKNHVCSLREKKLKLLDDTAPKGAVSSRNRPPDKKILILPYNISDTFSTHFRHIFGNVLEFFEDFPRIV